MALKASLEDWSKLDEAGHPLASLGRAQALTNLGTLSHGEANFAVAIQRFEEARTLFASLPPSVAKRRSVRLKLGKLLTSYGTCLESARKRSKSARALFEASEVLGGLVAEDPGSPVYRATRAKALHNLGVILQERRPQRAQESLESAVSECRELVSRWSKRPDFRATLARSLGQLGRVLRQRGELETGLARLEEARSELAGLEAKSALDVRAQRSYGMLLAEIGLIQARAANRSAAEEALRSAHRILRELRTRHVRSREDVAVLAAVCATLAPILLDRGAFETAEPVLVDAVEILGIVAKELTDGRARTVVGRDGALRSAKEQLASSWRSLVTARLELGRHSAACAAAAEYAKSQESEAATDFALRSLARCYELATAVEDATARREQRQIYVDHAIGLLERAIRAGWQKIGGLIDAKAFGPILEVESVSRRFAELRDGKR